MRRCRLPFAVTLFGVVAACQTPAGTAVPRQLTGSDASHLHEILYESGVLDPPDIAGESRLSVDTIRCESPASCVLAVDGRALTPAPERARELYAILHAGMAAAPASAPVVVQKVECSMPAVPDADAECAMLVPVP